MLSDNKKYYSTTLFYAAFPLLVLLSKVIRYTVLKRSTVDAGIGHSFIGPMLKQDIDFLFLWDTADESTMGSAANNAMFVFQKLTWLGCSTYEEFEFAITIIFNIILIYVLRSFTRSKAFLTGREFIFLSFYVGVLNIYTFVLSKEPVQMIYFMTIFFVLKGNTTERRKWSNCVVAMIFIIVMSRTYFVLMLMFAFGIRWLFIPVSHKFHGNFNIVFSFLVLTAGVAYMLFLFVCQSARPDDFQELIRVRLRSAEDTVTVITAVIETTDIPLFSVNYMITILRLLFPVELIRFGPQYIVFVAFQLMISAVALSSLKNYADSTPTKKIATSLFWGYILCSATFEPDFGSWIRHESATIPFMLFMLDNNTN